MAVGLCSLGLAGLGVGLCKRNSVLNILGMLNRHNPTTHISITQLFKQQQITDFQFSQSCTP